MEGGREGGMRRKGGRKEEKKEGKEEDRKEREKETREGRKKEQVRFLFFF